MTQIRLKCTPFITCTQVGINKTYRSTVDSAGTDDSDDSFEAGDYQQALVRNTVVTPGTGVKILIWLYIHTYIDKVQM